MDIRFKNISIRPEASILEAMTALDKTSEKVLFIVDDESVLIGSLSDGDIRRFILKGGELTEKIETIFQTKPIFVFDGDYERENLKNMFIENSIEVIPVLDKSKKIVDLISWGELFGNFLEKSKNKIDVPTVIMAGGRGTRLEPFTKVLPKPLVPLGDKTVVDHIIDNFRAYGISEFYLTVHHMSKIIRAYFEEKSLDYSVEIVEEVKPNGTAGSLSLLTGKLEKPFFVSNCDTVVVADYSDLYEFHKQGKFDITLAASTKQYNIPYGVCELNENGSLNRINEKPGYNFLVNTGLYVLNPDVIKYIPHSELYHITHLIQEVKKHRGTVGVYPISEKSWVDLGQWDEYRKALKTIEGI
jgi:dTDP-glucose pyrophosphorylase